ncbi:Muscle M-line assembly protein unc-89 [Wickerhamomyces ciferrii]|uniref:Muscle M-line assembly protein unc-89 n=1 Tax=Wickerhamomyces ciferrii (strain ATCC 14091 / BCRC 22168 / CBS 111 / JCM 3599 / NBRC 0793 / NRRL Y-1031 F-60-10) TaxID=1206466 RepID=K0KYR9_WICCF|nr:Muscle M-line assembly protein unc-89 [Wickerhamomyces ciferrii]CCH46554.1 Muscle M-line assembly protein unc-89 [Wickerhamomyces ciferrii]
MSTKSLNDWFSSGRKVIDSLENGIDNKQKDTRINELEKEIESYKQSAKRSRIQDPNDLNVKLNNMIRQNDELKKEVEELKYKKRTPLAPIKTENDSNKNILSMLKNSTPTKPKPQTTNAEIRPVSQDDLGTSSPQRLNNINDGSDLVPTQQTLDSEDFERPNYKYPQFKRPSEESIKPKRHIPIVPDTIDLRAQHFEVPSSPVQPEQSSTDDSEDKLSSPSQSKGNFPSAKVKYEPDDSVEILDSQQDEEDLEFVNNIKEETLKPSLPTPQTSSKFKTPLNFQKLNFKRSMLHTPDDSTPMKKPNKRSKSSTVYDLTRNPIKDCDWIIEDFKINPAKNGDVDFAFHEVLRGDKRQCAHGSTCKDCEKFYKNAQGDNPQAKIGSTKSGLKWNDESNYYTKPDNLVSKTSRHRTIFDRVPSPPGFGDFDFPSTQEQKKNREKSDAIRRKKAYERLFSAIKQGKFMFRDPRFNEAIEKNNYTIDEDIFDKYINIDLENI